MNVAFVHHGEKTRDDISAPLTQKGREQIHLAADFLKDFGIKPQKIISTSTQRTIESAQIISLSFTNSSLHQRSSIPELWEDWLDFGEELYKSLPEDHIIIGHHTTLGLLKHHFHLKLSLQSYSSVIILKRNNYHVWSVMMHHQGATSL